jgi:uncharacterized protein (UPF0262 family)
MRATIATLCAVGISGCGAQATYDSATKCAAFAQIMSENTFSPQGYPAKPIDARIEANARQAVFSMSDKGEAATELDITTSQVATLSEIAGSSMTRPTAERVGPFIQEYENLCIDLFGQ